MRALVPLALLLALWAAPTVSDAAMRTRDGDGVRRHAQHHRLHHLRRNAATAILDGGFYQTDAAPYGDGTVALAPALPPAPPLRVVEDPPTVEHTAVGVTVFRGPSHHIAP